MPRASIGVRKPPMKAKKAGAKEAKAGPKTDAPPLQASVPRPDSRAVKIASQSYEIRAISSLQPHPKNPRRGNVGAIGESLEANDFYGAAIVQKSTNFILVGNHRYKSAVEKGLREIPVIVVDVDDEKAERIMLADNRIADLANYDDRALLALLANRADGLTGTGFGDQDLAKLSAKVSPPETFPEFNGQVTVKYRCPSCSFEWS